MSIPRRFLTLLAGGALTAALFVTGATGAAAAAPGNCAGGSVATGTYSSLTISGICAIDNGNVTVLGNLTLGPNAGLNAALGGFDLHVGGNLLVGSGAILVLGCEPFAFPCFNDPNQQTGTPGFQTHDSVGHNLVADGALMMLVHASSIGGQIVQSGGGGGVNCDTFPFGPNGPPAYTTYEDNTVGANVIVDGVHTCWDGFFRNTVAGNVNWNNNITWDGTPEFSFSDTLLHGDEDGNEITTNTISGNLNCFGNFPAIQFGDSGGIPNTVAGKVRGQCTAVV
jgi:hypothetical protein